MFVLDACSRDHTVQFARGAGADVIQREWTDFVDARRFALAGPDALGADDRRRRGPRRRAARCDRGVCRATWMRYASARTTYFCGTSDAPMAQRAVGAAVSVPARATLDAHPAAGECAACTNRGHATATTGVLPGTLLHFSYPDHASYRAKYDATRRWKRGVRGSLPALATVRAYQTLRVSSWLLLAKGRASRRAARLVRRVSFPRCIPRWRLEKPWRE